MNERLVYLRERYLALIASTGATRGAPPNRPAGTFQHFRTEAERAEHLRQVAEAQKNGSVPF